MKRKPNNQFKPWGLTKKEGFGFVRKTIQNTPVGDCLSHRTDGSTAQIFDTVLNSSWIFGEHFTRGSYVGIFVGPDPYGGKNLRVGFSQPDGTIKYKTFSWPKALTPPTDRQRAMECARLMVRQQMKDFAKTEMAKAPLQCPNSGKWLVSYDDIEVHHKLPNSFRVLFDRFMAENALLPAAMIFDPGPRLHDGPVDAVMGGEDLEDYPQDRIPEAAWKFQKYHLEVAQLEIVSREWHKAYAHR